MQSGRAEEMWKHRVMGIAAALAVCSCSERPPTRDDVEVADVNARNALNQASALRDRAQELEDKIDDLEGRVEELEGRLGE